MSSNNNTTHLVLTAVGADKPGLVEALSESVFQSGCNVEDSRMTVLGGEFAILLLVSGNWNTLAKLEQQAQRLGTKLGLTVTAKRTGARRSAPNLLPYAVDVISLDHPGIVYHLAHFFSTRSINIEEMSTSCYAAAHTGTPMFSVHMEIGIPAELQIADLRETFMDFCDELNLDAVMEPIKS